MENRFKPVYQLIANMKPRLIIFSGKDLANMYIKRLFLFS